MLLLLQKSADISKIRQVLVLKVHFLKVHIFLYLRTKFQISSIALTSFRQRVQVILPAYPHTKKGTPESPSRLGLNPHLNWGRDFLIIFITTKDQIYTILEFMNSVIFKLWLIIHIYTYICYIFQFLLCWYGVRN